MLLKDMVCLEVAVCFFVEVAWPCLRTLAGHF